MPISQASIQRFLSRVHAEPPACKAMPAAELLRMIYNCTGAEYEAGKTQPRPHQLEGIAFSLYQRQSLLFYWMRLGKSFMALEWATHLRRANLVKQKCLILAHAPIGVNVWEGQVAQHSDLQAIAVRSGPDAQYELITALESNAELIIFSRHTAQALFTNNRLSRKGKPKLYPDRELLKLVASYFDHCIIDETHFYGDAYSLPFLLAEALTEPCKYRLGLSGTPVGRNPFVVWSQAFLIDRGQRFGTVYQFFEGAFGKRTRNPFTPTGYSMVFDQAKMPIFQYKLDSFSLAYGKNEVKSAEVFCGQIKLTMADEQRKAYNAAVTRLVTLRVGQQVEIDAIFHRLRQIASGYMPFIDADGQSQIVHFESAKLDWLAEFAMESDPSARCLIFHEYQHTGLLICKALAKAKIPYSWIWGGAKDKTGQLADFKSGKARWLVANAATGGTSIDLPEADYLCFFESPCSPITRAQAQARPMARALDRPLMVDDLICAPIEAKILGYIAEGDDMLAKLLAGGGKSAQELFA